MSESRALVAQEPQGWPEGGHPSSPPLQSRKASFPQCEVASRARMPQRHTEDARPIKTQHFGDADKAGAGVGGGGRGLDKAQKQLKETSPPLFCYSKIQTH